MHKSFCFLILLILFSTLASADSSHAAFKKLSFLEGCWKGESEGSVVYENWGNSDGNIMLGVSKTVSKGELDAFEFLSLVFKDQQILYMPYVNGKNTVSFPLINSTEMGAEFSNAAHDFPKSIKYKRNGTSLLITLAGDGPNVEYKMQSVPCP